MTGHERLIDRVNAIRNVPNTDLAKLVKRVLVILSSPRSGSTLVKSILAAHPDIASLDGEVEPFLSLTKNGFGFNSDSDALTVLSNRDDLVDNIVDDLTLPSQELPPLRQLKRRWANRVLLQFPGLFSEETERCRLIQSVEESLTEASTNGIHKEHELRTLILSRVFRRQPWRIAYYDGESRAGARVGFDEPLKIEEPPFVSPRLYRRRFTESDARSKLALFKAPPDVYRIGMYERLFPNAKVKYVHLTRGFAQSVNGLMDGWMSPVGFFSHDLRSTGISLSIKGYSDSVSFGRNWWKFDLPPNWSEFIDADLEDVCLNQWLSAHRAIEASGVPTLRISFEDFLDRPAVVIKELTQHLGLSDLMVPVSLPVTMVTEAPEPMRWRKREGKLLALGKREEVQAAMERQGYEMDPQTWL